MENYNFSYLHFNGIIRINIKTFKNYFQYKIYVISKEQDYPYNNFDSTDKDLLKNKIIEEVLNFSKTNNINMASLDPYWKVQIERSIETLTFPK